MTEASIPCPCCQAQKDKLYCPACLRQGMAVHDDLLRNIQARIDALIRNAERQLAHKVMQWRELRADVNEREQRCSRLRRGIAEKEARIANIGSVSRREKSAQRRESLKVIRLESPQPVAMAQAIRLIQHQQQQVSTRIRLARHVLVREAVTLFGVRQNALSDWEIAGLVLSSPASFRLYPSVNINAALGHVVHLLSLLTTYLSITLPYIPVSPVRPHVGRPVMRANSPLINSTKWRDKQVLWMSSSASIATKSRSSLTSNVVAKSANKHRQFLTSFALFSFSIAYLAWSQGVPWVGIKDEEEINSDEETQPRTSSSASNIVSATSVLELIHSLSYVPTLGQTTHEPGTSPVLRHLGFGLDISKVVQIVLSAEQSRWGESTNDGHMELSEEWDMVDD